MKPSIILATTVIALATNAYAAEIFDSYDRFYAKHPRALFGEPIKFDSGTVYSKLGERGNYVKLQASLEGKPLRVEVASDRIVVNGATYRFSRATTFPGEYPSDIYPPGANAFLVSRTNDHSAALCVEGASNGSGEANRHTQIYLLIDPSSTKARPRLLHLPSLLSSCRAIVTAADGKIAFPKNTYLLDAQQESRVGLLLSYYTSERQRFVPIHSKTRLRFTRPNAPFQFEIQR